MKTDLQIKNAAEIETECLVVAVVDKGDKDKSIASVLTSERPLQDAAQELEDFLYPPMRSKTQAACLKRLQRSLERIGKAHGQKHVSAA